MTDQPADRRTVRVRIEGRVQGVGFRFWTERVAIKLGLSGWVRNRSDGSVEAVFSGSPDAVAAMLARCKDGPPPSARVDRIDVEDESTAPPDSFHVKPTV